ncbi:MAG: hypothetical protein ABUS56_11885 [Acidobacteriota bacterium]
MSRRRRQEDSRANFLRRGFISILSSGGSWTPGYVSPRKRVRLVPPTAQQGAVRGEFEQFLLGHLQAAPRRRADLAADEAQLERALRDLVLGWE